MKRKEPFIVQLLDQTQTDATNNHVFLVNKDSMKLDKIILNYIAASEFPNQTVFSKYDNAYMKCDCSIRNKGERACKKWLYKVGISNSNFK